MPLASQSNSNFKGDHLSVKMFGAVADGVTDDSAAFNDAFQAIKDLGIPGCGLYIPGGDYGVSNVEIPSDMVPFTMFGDGLSTKLIRVDNAPANKGVIDIQGCPDIWFKDFVYDGDVTSSTGILYSTIAGDPMYSALVANTGFWAHPGTDRLRFRGVTIQHTGGYAILIDTEAGPTKDVRILDCLFQNNRPHLFGTSGGDLNYGSWTGGIFVNGDGQSFGDNKLLSDFLVRHCTFRRNTGNCLWSHLNGLDELHSNFRWIGNHFEDIGLDGMGVNGVTGGVVESNTVRRNGYICSDDTSPSTPKYLANAYSVGLDTAGLTKGVAYKGNSFTSPNGAAMDLDGYADGCVSGNVARVPVVGEPEYTEDQIASTGVDGGNISYGLQVSNSNNHVIAGSNITVVGNTFINLSGGAIRMYASRNCHVSDNTVVHPAGASIQPIILGNIGTGDNQRAYGNVVTQNRVDYSPASPVPVVFEDNTLGAFSGTDSNWVFGNFITGNGNAFEFLKNSATVSVTEGVQATQDVTADVSNTVVERTGTGDSSITRWHGVEGSTRKLLLNMQHKLYNSSVVLVGGPLFNITEDGVAGAGSVSTGDRTTLAFDDAVATSRGVADGFLAVNDSTFTYPNDPAADLLPATWGLIRYKSASTLFEVSTSVSAGHRVWTPMTFTPGGSNTQVQYNNSGSLAGSANFTWNNGSQLLTVTATGSGAAGIVCATGYIQADAGFYATVGTATSFQAIQAPGGGVYGKSLRAINYTQLGNSSGVPTATSGDSFVAGAIYWDTGSTSLMVYNGSSWTGVGGVTSLNSLTGALSIVGTSNQIVVTPSGSNITLSTPQDIGTSSAVQFASVVVPNSSGYFGAKDTGAATRVLLSYGSDDNTYLDNPKSGQDVYIRPATGRFVFMGRASAEFVCPNGDQTATLGHASYKWTSVIAMQYKLNSTVIVDGSANAAFLSLTINSNSIISSAGEIQSPITGSSIAFQTANTNFQVDGNGNISGAGSFNATGGSSAYKMGGVTVIDVSRDLYLDGIVQEIANAATVGGVGVSSTYDFRSAYNSSASIGSTSLLVGGGNPPAGQYLLTLYLNNPTTGVGTLTITITFTDTNSNARTITIGTLSLATAFNIPSVLVSIDTDGSGISLATTYASPGSYSIAASLIRVY